MIPKPNKKTKFMTQERIQALEKYIREYKRYYLIDDTPETEERGTCPKCGEVTLNVPSAKSSHLVVYHVCINCDTVTRDIY